MSQQKRLHFNTLVSAFKESNASQKNVEAIFDFVYLLEHKERNYQETTLLVEAYCLLGFYIQAYDLFSLLKTQSFSSKEAKKHQKKLRELEKNKRLHTRFHYRDLRQARILKEINKLTEDDFFIINEDKKYRMSFKDELKKLVVFNKYISTTAIFISADQIDLDSVSEYFLWLGNCKKELINFYNQKNIEYKIDKADQHWFDGLEIFDIDIEVKKGTIFGHIAIIDYSNNNLGFHLETINQTIHLIEYDGIL